MRTYSFILTVLEISSLLWTPTLLRAKMPSRLVCSKIQLRQLLWSSTSLIHLRTWSVHHILTFSSSFCYSVHGSDATGTIFNLLYRRSGSSLLPLSTGLPLISAGGFLPVLHVVNPLGLMVTSTSALTLAVSRWRQI